MRRVSPGEREMWGKAVKAESPSGNGIVLASAETGQVGVGERETVGYFSKFNNSVILLGEGRSW